jgi:hypothetical protein
MKISQSKTEAMCINSKNANTFTLGGKEIGNVDKFPYLGSTVIM